ncbi:acyl-CoA dehydrogenase family protein [bacterium]|nr:acyl-CoA dehydrogenase family protein [bacterium]MBU1675935.1 acyl-CoA dehydrogenase family protein [bacterium]
MDFSLTEQQTMFRDMVRDFAQQEIAPIARRMDDDNDMPGELVEKMKANGFFGLAFPERYGGLGADTVTYGLVVEELSAVSAGVSVMVCVHNSVGSYPIAMFANEAIKAEILPRMAAGEIAAFCVTEPDAGSDAVALATTARRDGDAYVLDGSKIFVTNGARAQFFMVLARTPGTKGYDAIHAFLVERGTPGLTVGKKEDKMGLRASDTVTIEMDGARVPATRLLGAEGDGFKIAMKALDGGRIGIAFQALGIGRACLEATVRYAGQREAFGKHLWNLDVIRHKIADMAARLHAARLTALHAATLKDAGRPFTKEAAMAKLLATEAAGYAADEAVQIHGGYGYMKEYDVERWYRDVRVTRIYEGASEIQRLVIARHVIKELG